MRDVHLRYVDTGFQGLRNWLIQLEISLVLCQMRVFFNGVQLRNTLHMSPGVVYLKIFSRVAGQLVIIILFHCGMTASMMSEVLFRGALVVATNAPKWLGMNTEMGSGIQ